MEPQPLSESEGARIAFWVIAGFSVVASAITWAWYGLAQEEAQSEQGKAVAAVGAASLIGVLFAQLLWAGELFELGINIGSYVP